MSKKIADDKQNTSNSFNLNNAAIALLNGDSPTNNWTAVTSSKITKVFYHNIPPYVFFKTFVDASLKEKIKSIYRGSRCKRAVRENNRLLQLGFNTPKTLLWGKSPQGEWFITEAVNAAPLGSYFSNFCKRPDNGTNANWKHQLQKALGDLTGRLHKTGIHHSDLRLNNILIDLDESTPKYHLIDNEGNRHFKKRMPEKLMMKNLVQINMFFPDDFTLAGRMRIMQAYFKQAGPKTKAEQRRIFKEVLATVSARLAKKAPHRKDETQLSGESIKNHPNSCNTNKPAKTDRKKRIDQLFCCPFIFSTIAVVEQLSKKLSDCTLPL